MLDTCFVKAELKWQLHLSLFVHQCKKAPDIVSNNTKWIMDNMMFPVALNTRQFNNDSIFSPFLYENPSTPCFN